MHFHVGQVINFDQIGSEEILSDFQYLNLILLTELKKFPNLVHFLIVHCFFDHFHISFHNNFLVIFQLLKMFLDTDFFHFSQHISKKNRGHDVF